MKTIYEQSQEDLNRPDRPPLCTDCKWFASSRTNETEKHKCLAPDNYAGISLVDGSTMYKNYYAQQQRTNHTQYCGISGMWFIKMEPRIVEKLPEYMDTVTNIQQAAAKRLSDIKSGKKIDPSKLNNL